MKTWMHIDMDMFYAAVTYFITPIAFSYEFYFYIQIEIRDDQSLADKPVAVGDMSMIQTTNYVARKFNIHSGLPGFIGKRLCKELHFVKPDLEKYKRISDEIKNILKQFDAEVETPSPDEFILEASEYLQKH